MSIKPRSPQRAVDLSPDKNDELVGAEGYVFRKRVAYDGAPVESMEKVRVPVFSSAPARVKVAGGVTQNMGDYNSARVDVMVELPCLPEASEIERAYGVASGMVDRFLREELNAATGGNNG